MNSRTYRIRALPGLLAIALALTWLVAAPARAVTEDELLTSFGSRGAAAGQYYGGTPLATSPESGRVYVVGSGRVNEFTAWGNFVKAFGWDVAPGAVNEEQELTVRGTAGGFTLAFATSTTIDLAHDAPAAESEGPNSVEAALNALPSISAGGGGVTVEKGPRSSSSSRYVVRFDQGPLAAMDVQQLVVGDGSDPLTGGSPGPGAVVATRADGHTATSGLESCTVDSGCQEGVRGTGSGQISNGVAMAVDAGGNIYLREFGGNELGAGNERVQKFDSAGRFVLMFGGEVNETTGENICTEISGDQCGAGVSGTAAGEFSAGRGVALGASGEVFVADAERIQEFKPDGTFQSEIPVPGEIIDQLAVDSETGDFYVTFLASSNFPRAKANVRKLSPSGAALGTLDVARPVWLTMKPGGGIYAVNQRTENSSEEFIGAGFEFQTIFEFSSDGARTLATEVRLTTFEAIAITANAAGDLYVSRSGVEKAIETNRIELYGPPPVQFEPPPQVQPTISAQYAASVSPEDATLAVEINPQFWDDTRYYVEYGTGKCSEGGCEARRPIPPGTALTTRVVNEAVRGTVLIEGLEPSTTYHYRFVSSSGGGGPVHGIDPDGEGPQQPSSAEGLEATFTTPAPRPAGDTDCGNQAFRGGFSAQLPDCRAYEMVSPVDKSGGDIFSLPNAPSLATSLYRSSTDGGSFTYTSYRAFGDAQAGSYANQYLATRDSGGWSSTSLSAARGPIFPASANHLLDTEFKAFSDDLCSAWLLTKADPPLAQGAPAGFPNFYRRDNCSPGYEALTTAEPTLRRSYTGDTGRYLPDLQGFSADGKRALIHVEQRFAPPEPGEPLKCDGTSNPSSPGAYRWLRDGVPIAGASAVTYSLTTADAGTAIQCQYTATAGGVGSTALANPAVEVSPVPEVEAPSAPAAIAAPGASGPLPVGGPAGQTLSCDPDASGWGGAPSFAYRWYRNGAEIAGAESQDYAVTAADLASTALFQCAVFATNEGARVAATSAPLATSPAPSPAAPLAVADMPSYFKLYEASAGALNSVCVFPTGTSVATKAQLPHCSAGSPSPNAENEGYVNRSASISHAISADGARIYWSASSAGNEIGRIYLREEGAVTLPVSETVGSAPARFLGAAADGSAALFKVEQPKSALDRNLYVYSREGQNSTLIASKVLGVAGQSDDLSSVYFVSEEALGSANAQGQSAAAGQPNLYLAHAGTIAYIATLATPSPATPDARVNLGEPRPSNIEVMPAFHAARATPDGSHLVFFSTRSLTGYDNRDQASGRPAAEVYLYDAGSAALRCVSCNPSGSRALAGESAKTPELSLFAAAWIPTPPNQFTYPRALSDDGSRLFFNALDALISSDTNGKTDVYEWERPGAGRCGQTSPAFSAANGGCLYLISSGENAQNSEFVESSPGGRDVFFTTGTSLLPQDPGLIDVYNAREGGGFPPPPPPPAQCEGEICQGPSSPPDDSTPASSTFNGAGNVGQPATKGRCLKGKVRRRGRCTKPRTRHAKHQKHHNRGGKGGSK